MAGLFVTFEGGEGTGKSSHARRLAERLTEVGRTVVLTREPGGSPGGEDLRELLVTGSTGRWSAEAEALLNYAARDAHLRETIRPALHRGEVVICDRFMDSTRAYQGYAGGCDLGLIDTLEKHIVRGDRPTLTFILDLGPSQGLARARGRENMSEDRFERKGIGYHERLRNGFREIARDDPSRCRLIDSSRAPDAVAADIWASIAPLAGATR